MRLIDIKHKINIAFENYKLKYQSVNGGNIRFDNVENLRTSIKALRDINYLPDEDPYSFFLSAYSDTIIVDSNQHPAIIDKLKHLNYALALLNDWINDYVPADEDEETINIKFPRISDIEDLIKSCNLINKSLSQSVSEIGGQITFKQLDYGSSWLIISVGTTAATSLVMAIAKAAFYIAKKFYGIKMMAQAYERYKMGTDVMKTMKECNEMILKEEMDKQSKEIEKKFYPDMASDNERCGRLRVAISEMYKLIELGGEVHPSLLLKDDSDKERIDYKQLSKSGLMDLLPKNDGEPKNASD